jgi:hypothetical protein
MSLRIVVLVKVGDELREVAIITYNLPSVPEAESERPQEDTFSLEPAPTLTLFTSPAPISASLLPFLWNLPP